MDSLILTFNQKQMQIYKELISQENIDLNFNTDLQIEKVNYDFDNIISDIEKEAIELLKFKKNSVSFSAFLTVEEIKEFIPVYYKAIKNINAHKIKIGSHSWDFSFKIEESNKMIADINRRYSNFLPYKAALYNREKYAFEIEKLDAQFKSSIEKAESYKKELLHYFNKANKICDIVSDFFSKSSKATDEPKFKKFDSYDFFWTLDAFLEQLKSIKQKEM